VLRCPICRVCCFDVAGRSSGLSGAGFLLGLAGVSSVFSDGISDCLWSINTSTFELFTIEGAAIFVYSLQTGSLITGNFSLIKYGFFLILSKHSIDK
jgi:hypothetical protein